MRFLGRTLFVSTIMVVMVGLYFALTRKVDRESTGDESSLERRESVAYAVERQRDLEFRLSGHADQVRLRTHGLVPRYPDDAPLRTHDYALAITILSADGTVLAERTEHYRASLIRLRNAVTGEPERVNVVADETVDVIGTALTILDLAGLPSAEVLRIRLAEADPDIREIGLRLYEPEATPEHSIAASWRRLSVPQRERLADGNVYPMPLLTDEETAAIMTRRWRPLGPAGIEGEDYRIRFLQIREAEGGPADRPVIPTGLYVDLRHQGTLTIRDQGRYLVRATAVPGSSAAAADRPMLRLRSGAGREILLPWSAATIEDFVDLAPDIVTVTSDRPAAIRVYRVTADERIELAPAQRAERAFRVSATRGLDFAVHRRVAVPVRVRLDVRQWLSDPEGAAAAVTYAATDLAGNVVDGGVIHVGDRASPNESLVDDPTAALSVPVRRELTLAPGVVNLRLSADRAVYVSAHNRIERNDGTAESDIADASGAADGWFGFMPVGGPQLIRDGETIVVVESGGLSDTDGVGDAP